jgi:uncharacterized protein YPO0396
MLSLTRIFLHNWHRFTSVTLEVQDSLYLTGHNGSGKSTILDAIQVVLLADLNLIKFNSSAQERSERTLNGFVRGKITETRWLRPGNCVGYIVLEFTDTETGRNTLLGCCIEAGESLGPNGERTYFILHERLDTTFFLWEGQPRTRSQLKKMLQRDHNGKYYDVIKEYQDDLLVALGNLHRRFFDRFRHAFSFTPITNVNRFVEEWLLNEHPLQLQNLLLVVNRLEDLRQTAKVVEEKIVLLRTIGDTQRSYQRFKFLQGQFELLYALLQKEEAEREVAALEQEIRAIEDQWNEAEQENRDIQAALQGAKNAREETAKQLYGLDVVKQQQILNEKIREKTLAADALLAAKAQLLQELHNIAALLQALLETALLEVDELPSISVLHEMLLHLTSKAPLAEELPTLVDTAMTSLRSVLERIRGRKIALEEQITQSEERIHELEDEIRLLAQGASISYPSQVRILCERLEAIIGKRPTVLCELLEVPDERWQTAVEALLGERRFLILVPVGTYEHVLQYIETIKKDIRLHDASVLDLEKAYVERREALPDSLAQEITTDDPYLRAYIDSVLGNIITCTSAQEARKYRRAITADLVYYNEWAVRVLPSERFRVWFVGKRARASQIEARRQEQELKRQELLRLIPLRNQARKEESQLDGGLISPLLLLRKSLDTPPEDTPLRLEIASLTAERDALDMSSATPLKAELKRLDEVIKEEERASRTISERLGNLSSTRKTVADRKQVADTKRAGRKQKVTEMQGKYPTAIGAAEKLFQEQKGERELTQVISNADRAAKSFITQSENAMKDLRDLGLSYNLQYRFAGIPGSLDNDRYQQELERLEATELPQYEARISQAKQEAEQELREHVLHILRERIANAKDELQRMNEALKPLTFHGDHYQFRWYPADTMREYHDLIVNSQLLGAGSLFESEFYQNNQETFDKFYEELTRIPQSDAEKKAKERLTDYRTYLEYDIEVKHHDLTTSRLSRIAGETSGGETQTPFYVAVAASFVQLYHIMDEGRRRRGRPTIRLAVFDEAFNRMDQDRIGVTLDMLQQFGLQIITATPLERCEYLVPKICTNLVLTRVGEVVHIDEYSNYAAKLEEMYAEGTTDTAARS